MIDSTNFSMSLTIYLIHCTVYTETQRVWIIACPLLDTVMEEEN